MFFARVRCNPHPVTANRDFVKSWGAVRGKGVKKLFVQNWVPGGLSAKPSLAVVLKSCAAGGEARLVPIVLFLEVTARG